MTPLKKAEFIELATGYIAPNGDFYPCQCFDHLATAAELFEMINGYEFCGDAENQLMKAGWISIHVLSFMEHGFLFSFTGHLTPEQIRVIKPVVEENWIFIIKSNQRDLKEEFNR